jgi:hypothetical protein
VTRVGTTVGGGGSAVLEDPTGRRARWLGRAGRVAFVLFLGWLVAIVLGGLGLMPVAGIPLTHALRPSQGPPPLAKHPLPRKPSASDLRPALSAEVFAATANAAEGASHVGSRAQKTTPAAGTLHGKSATAPGKTKTAPAHGRSTVAPGQTKTTPAAGASQGKSATAPGQTKTTSTAGASQGKSATAPGQTKTTPATGASHGKSTTAPGKTTTTAPAGPHGQRTVAPGQTKTTTTSVRQPKKP